MSRSRVSAAPSQANGNPDRSRARQSQSHRQPSKRLILCEDGTWLDSDSSSVKGSISIPSNVTRISRAIKAVSSDGIPQVVYYHFGVGGSGGWLNKIAGFNGAGIDEIIREGYEFLCANYTPGDEIYIFGFSRGAYTARSIAGLIDQVGLLTKDGIPDLPEIYRDVTYQYDDHYVPKYPDIPFPNKPSASDPAYKEGLAKRRLTRLHIPIKVIGVWETVGSLGVPKIPWLQRLGIQSTTMKYYRLHDTALCNCVEYAFQALALDERRYSFSPCLWEKLDDNETVLRQVWFPGAHSNAGGGYSDQQIGTISLAWMVAQCQPFLDFDLDYVVDQWEESEEYEERHAPETRPWSFGEIFTGMTATYAIGGSAIRSPGRYCYIEPTTGKATNEPLVNTREFIHPCVRARVKLKGPDFENKGVYDCKALRNWKLVIENEEGRKRPHVYWRSRARPPEGFVGELPEAPLKPLEIELLEYDRETCDYILNPSGMRRRGTNKSRGDG